MPGIDPDLALEVAKATADAYADAVEELTAQIARQTRKGTYDPDGWATRKLAEINQLRAQADAVVAQLAAQTPGLVDTAVRTAYSVGRGVPIATHTRAVDQLVAEATTRVMSTHGQILRSVDDAYRDIVTRTSLLVDTGTLSVDAAVRQTLADFARQGLTGFVDRAGRRWRLDRYAEMAVRTASGRAHVAGTLDQIAETGGALVIVSDHLGSCDVCAAWEGKVLTIYPGGAGGSVEDGNGHQVPIAGSVADAQAAGFMHPNCRHTLTRMVEGLTVAPGPPGDDEAAFERRRAANAAAERRRARARLKAAETGGAPEAREVTRSEITAGRLDESRMGPAELEWQRARRTEAARRHQANQEADRARARQQAKREAEQARARAARSGRVPEVRSVTRGEIATGRMDESRMGPAELEWRRARQAEIERRRRRRRRR